jgi:hypothetical protein
MRRAMNLIDVHAIDSRQQVIVLANSLQEGKINFDGLTFGLGSPEAVGGSLIRTNVVDFNDDVRTFTVGGYTNDYNVGANVGASMELGKSSNQLFGKTFSLGINVGVTANFGASGLGAIAGFNIGVECFSNEYAELSVGYSASTGCSVGPTTSFSIAGVGVSVGPGGVSVSTPVAVVTLKRALWKKLFRSLCGDSQNTNNDLDFS